GAILFVARDLGSLVEPSLADHRIHADGGFAGGTVADDQFALAAANRDHGVHCHNTGLDGLADGFAFDDTGRDFLDGIKRVGFDWPFAVYRLAKSVDDATQHRLADRHLEDFTGGADFVAFLDLGVITKDNRAHLGLFKVKREAGDAVAEIKHLVQHRIG